MENCQEIPDYLLRFFHINKEISRHFPVRLRIRHKREESQICHPTFLSRGCHFSSSALSPPRFWVCHLAWWWWWCWARHSPSPLRRVRPRLWSRWWPWSLCASGSPDQWRGAGFSTGPANSSFSVLRTQLPDTLPSRDDESG